MSGLVARVLESSFIDGPGHRAVVFLQGCDFSCLYCHNPETQRLCESCGACVPVCPAGALSSVGGRVIWNESSCVRCDTCIRICPNYSSPRVRAFEAPELADRLLGLLPFIDGVTFSGGECSLQSGFILELAALLHTGAADRGQDLSLIADTNGATEGASFDGFLAGMDGFIFDLKAPTEDEHLALTGRPLAPVIANMGKAAAAGKLVEVRTVLVEGRNDGPADIEAAADVFASMLSSGASRPNYRLIPFRPQGVRGEFAPRRPYPLDRFEEIVGIMRKRFGPLVVTPVS